MREAVDNGLIAKGDTIADVAKALGLDEDIVQDVVNEWNAACDAGEDPAGLMPTDLPASACHAALLRHGVGALTFATHGGPGGKRKCPGHSTRLGKPIKGLYASGCTIGIPSEGANGSCAFAAGTAALACKSMIEA